MVKGISKRIVHVKTPSDMFSEAIFILKEETSGVTEDEIVKEAMSLASKTGVKSARLTKGSLSAVCFSALGAVFVGALWIISAVI